VSELFSPGDKITQNFDMTIVEKIAEGGMGEVYEAILHGASGFEKRIALKVVRADFASKDIHDTSARELDFLTRLVNEAKLVSNLIHTHIVQIYLLGTLQGFSSGFNGFVAMEYVHGVSLRNLIDKHLFNGKKIPVDIAVYIASRIARALEYAHKFKDRSGRTLGIVHRDVSPTNVLISLDGVVKLSDFGIAKAVNQDFFPGEYIVGKRRYMAPEQAVAGEVDFRADIFSLGILLYEMLCNSLPDRSILPPPISNLRDDLPNSVEFIIEKTLQLNPAMRYSDTSDLAVDLEKVIYEKGYGPTFVTLSEYLRQAFPAMDETQMINSNEEKTILFNSLTPNPFSKNV